MSNYLKLAINEALKGLQNHEGAPFGACIVQNNQVIALAHDTVLKDQDATCHAEINAIRKASNHLKSYQLNSCQIYCTSEPCPMCMAAIHWAGIKDCYFIADRSLAASYGFDDSFLYEELSKPPNSRIISMTQQSDLFEKTKDLFKLWQELGLPVC